VNDSLQKTISLNGSFITLIGKLWYLKKFDLFSKLAQEDVESLAEQTTMDNVKAHRPIYLPGDNSDTIYLLKKGRVKIYRSNPDGKKITLALLEPGEIFGELAITEEEERSTGAETTDDSLICSVSDDKFLDFLSGHPELNFKISRVIGDRRRKIETKIENLIFKDASGRLGYVLKNLFEEHGDDSSSEEKLLEDSPRISFSHQEIADLCGLTRPTTTKILNEYEEKGIVELKRRNIVLKDCAALIRNLSDES
jgi:CRP/FNR family cyclic AMP-dependent transcriptional regulator